MRMICKRKFQFHKGTIKTLLTTPFTSRRQHFNSIKVRLKLPDSNISVSAKQHFNSIKVRLKHLSCLVDSVLSEFQFHKGTIKTGDTGCRFHSDRQFQFHKGTIKTLVCYSCLEFYIISIP